MSGTERGGLVETVQKGQKKVREEKEASSDAGACAA